MLHTLMQPAPTHVYEGMFLAARARVDVRTAGRDSATCVSCDDWTSGIRGSAVDAGAAAGMPPKQLRASTQRSRAARTLGVD